MMNQDSGEIKAAGDVRFSAPELIKELDRLLHMDLASEAEAFLKKQLLLSRTCGDWQTELTILNELSGFYRNQQNKEAGLCASEEGISLIRAHGLSETVTAGTTYLNAATTLKAFGKTAESLPYYEEARRIYERFLMPGDYRFAGLFNNLGLAYTEIGDFSDAEACFMRAVKIMRELPESTLEIGVTYVNLATLYDKWGKGEQAVSEWLKQAWSCFEDPGVKRNAYYAFNCRKCAGTFGYYGFFLYEDELSRRAEEIYAKNRQEGFQKEETA